MSLLNLKKKDVFELWIVEGPAGAGKSTLIRKLVEKGLAQQPIPFREMKIERPRAYLGDFGPMHSQVKDLISLHEAFYTWATEESGPIVLDRLMLSQWVYGTIRRGQSHLNYLEGSKIIWSGLDLLTLSWDHWLTRNFHEPNRLGALVHFWILCPEPGVLRELRYHSDRYVYDPFIESALYKEASHLMQEMIDELKDDFYSSTCLRSNGISYSSLEELENLAERVAVIYEPS